VKSEDVVSMRVANEVGVRTVRLGMAVQNLKPKIAEGLVLNMRLAYEA
jgi:hypothetical protein